MLFAAGEDPIGQRLKIRGLSFEVIGVYRVLNVGGGNEDAAESIYIPFTTFQSSFNSNEEVGWFVLLARDGVPASTVEAAALARLRERHTVAPDDIRAFGSYNLEKDFNNVRNLFTGIRILVWIDGIGTLAAGVIGVSNIMLIIVRERTR